MKKIVAVWMVVLGTISMVLWNWGICYGAGQVQVIREVYEEANSRAFYPRLAGMSDSVLENRLNHALKNKVLSLMNQESGSTLHGDFQIVFYNGELLGLEFAGDSYTPKMAHPRKIDCGIYMDMSTGAFYQLEDLFVSHADFAGVIREICRKQDGEYRLWLPTLWDGWRYEDFADSWRNGEESYLFQENFLRVYSMPRHVTGFISGYGIPYEALQDIINKEGALWRKLQKPRLSIDIAGVK